MIWNDWYILPIWVVGILLFATIWRFLSEIKFIADSELIDEGLVYIAIVLWPVALPIALVSGVFLSILWGLLSLVEKIVEG